MAFYLEYNEVDRKYYITYLLLTQSYNIHTYFNGSLIRISRPEPGSKIESRIVVREPPPHLCTPGLHDKKTHRQGHIVISHRICQKLSI